MLGAALGYRVRLVLPGNVGATHRRILRAFGAELTYSSPHEGSDGAIREAQRRYAGDPERYFYSDQYNNPANWQAHFNGTGIEILGQTGGALTHFVAGWGRAARHGHRPPAAARRARRVVAVRLDSPLTAWGLKHIATAIAGHYDPASPTASRRPPKRAGWSGRRARRHDRSVGGRGLALRRAGLSSGGRPAGRGVEVLRPPSGGDEGWPETDSRATEGIRDRLGQADNAAGSCSGPRATDTVRAAPAACRQRARTRPGATASDHARDYQASERVAREAGLDVVGFYHSHPDAPARPSQYDLDHAWPWYSYVIVATSRSGAGEITSWVLEDDRSRFAPEPIEIGAGG
jgi:proteasome lid subunit RPN8/RPN11